MRIARFTTGEDPRYAVIEGEPGAEELVVIAGDPLYTPIQPTGERVPLIEVRLLAPVIPRSKVIGVGHNYADHAKELHQEVPDSPLVFLVPNTAVVGPDDPIVLPSFSSEVDHEVELGVVIKRICKDVPAERASEVILGYTVVNDVSARDAQRNDGQWARAKGFDTACPIGPWIETDFDPTEPHAIRARVDGQVRQDGLTSDTVFQIPEIIAYVSAAFTLLPGDVIMTGTPAGVGHIDVGQRVDVEVEGIGVLSNPVVRH